MNNIIKNISDGPGLGVNLAREYADKHEKKTGNKTIVTRVIDYVDQYNGRDREHFSFDVIEIIE